MNDSIYLDRYAWPNPVFPTFNPPSDLGMVVVLPAYKEPEIEVALNALNECIAPKMSVLILIIVNESEDESNEASTINRKCLDSIKKFNSKYPILSTLQILPHKKAGVGLARKIGMDEAVRILRKSNQDGVIVCYDADCRCDDNYLVEIEKAYENDDIHAGIVFYEHQLHRENHEAILNYELYLRYYIDALRFTGFPYAHQTLGSCITVRRSLYEKVGGMNTRKAGEDFYFLNKTIPHGGFIEINNTTVRPSDRVSDRVPFGTGKAINDLLTMEEYDVYHPNSFEDLRLFFSRVDSFWQEDDSKIPKSVATYLGDDWKSEISKLKSQVSTKNAFIKRFFEWFDAFQILKYIHYARDHFYQNVTLEEALSWLKTHAHLFKGSLESQLIQLRYLDRNFK